MARAFDLHQQETYEAAEAALARRAELGRVVFGSARHAVAWYMEQVTLRGEPRVQQLDCDRDYRGVRGSVPVRGGRLQDPDEALVVLLTIGQALRALGREQPIWHRALILCTREGRSQEKAAYMLGVTQQTVSRWIGYAESFLCAIFVECEILR